MTVIADFRDRLNNDAKFAAQFAGVKDESDFIELATSEGYSLAPQDIYSDIELTDEDLQTVQGGSVFLMVMCLLAVFAGSIALTGAGIGVGTAIQRAANKKRKR